MGKYIIKRILLIPVLLLLVSMLTFWLVNLQDMEVAYTVLGSNATEEAVAAWNAERGLDKPLAIQYFNYIKNIVTHFDFGKSYRSGIPVLQQVKSVVWPTIKISFFGFLFTIILGVPLGILCAVKQDQLVDKIISFISMAFTAIPAFLWGVVLMLLFSIKLKWLPSFGLNGWKSYVMPVLAGGLPGLTVFIRFTRSAMLDTISQDYIRTSRAKGNSEQKVIFGDALGNAMLPIAAFVGSILAGVLASSVVIEKVFSITGLGLTIINAISTKDTPIILGCVLFLSAYYIVVTILVDVAFTFIDPRVKASFVSVRKKKAANKDRATEKAEQEVAE